MDKSLYASMVGDFGPVITLVVVIVVALIAVLRLGVRFDVNMFLEGRKQRHLLLARSCCTHMSLEPCEGGVEVRSLWYSPSGTLDWVCSRCGMVTHVPPDNEQTARQAEHYASNPDEYAKRMKEFAKHAR